MFGPSEGEEKPLWGGHRQWDGHFSLHLHWIFCLVSHDWMTAQWLAPIYDDQHWQTYTYTSEDPTCYWKTGKTKYIFPCGCPYYCSPTTAYSSCWSWQSWKSVELQGCSQGFHIDFSAVSWLSTGFTDLWWVSAASRITARMEWKAGSVSGVSGVVSDGSLVRS